MPSTSGTWLHKVMIGISASLEIPPPALHAILLQRQCFRLGPTLVARSRFASYRRVRTYTWLELLIYLATPLRFYSIPLWFFLAYVASVFGHSVPRNGIWSSARHRCFVCFTATKQLILPYSTFAVYLGWLGLGWLCMAARPECPTKCYAVCVGFASVYMYMYIPT